MLQKAVDVEVRQQRADAAPCGTPRLTALPPSMRRAPFPSVVSTGDWSQSLISRSRSPSAMRRAIDFISSAWGMVSRARLPPTLSPPTSVCRRRNVICEMRHPSSAARAITNSPAPTAPIEIPEKKVVQGAGCQSLGSMGSLSSASTANTHSWTRLSGSRATKRFNAS